MFSTCAKKLKVTFFSLQTCDYLLLLQEMLDRLVKIHGSMNLEWLRDVPPKKAK